MPSVDLGLVVGADGLPGTPGTPGAQGAQGKGFNPRGSWVAGTSYVNSVNVIDVVLYDASAYYCKQSHSRTVTPDNDPDYWGLLVQGGVSGEVFFGIGVTGTSTTPAVFIYSGVTYATVGDVYWNVSNGVDRGNMYKCETAGDATTAEWAYVGNISTVVTALDGSTTSINYELEANAEKTFSASGITSIALTIPSSSYQGFISEVDFLSGASAPTLTITNNSGKPLKYTQRGQTLDSYSPKANTEVNLLFRDNGASILCAILELE